MGGGDVIWNPVRGKFAIFSSQLAHFDLYLAAGAGALGTISSESKERVAFAGNVGVGVRLLFNQLVAVRLDYRQFFYPAVHDAVWWPSEFTVAVTVWTH